MVGGGVVVLVVALLGIAGWYVLHTQASQSAKARAEAIYEERKQPVTVTFAVTAPPNTPKDQVLYVSGSVPALGNWDAAGVPLNKDQDAKYRAAIADLLNGQEYLFKITRGTWGTVEASKDGKDIKDRVFTASKDATIEVAVEQWLDNGQSVPGRVTMTGDIRVHKNAIPSSILGNPRSLIVYLPPGYEQNAQQRYPVLYLQDGQNLFDEATSYQGIEWKLDEAAQKLIGDGHMKPAILVGVYNSPTRDAEYTPPFGGLASDKARGDKYAQMLVKEVKPFIDQRYRTLADRDNTFVGGGSLGGLVALYAARTHNDVFGGVVALSPWLRLGETSVVKDTVGDGAWLKNTKLIVDMGTDGGHNYPGGGEKALPDAQAFVAAVEAAGVTQGERFQYREIEGGKHNEASWAATAEQVLLSLLGTMQAPATTQTTASQIAN
jgi:enterochelin esterase-like enzyme